MPRAAWLLAGLIPQDAPASAAQTSSARRVPAMKLPASPTRSHYERGATKRRILEAAERLFLKHGFEATSMRAITTLARVNLAAVNYHFGSKEALFTQILTRRLDPMMNDRHRLLVHLRNLPADTPLLVERLIAAMFLPALALARDPERGGEDFLKFLGRAFADPSPFVQRLLAERYSGINELFKEAFSRALPEQPPEQLAMRLHFILDAVAATLASEDARRLMSALAARSPGGAEDDVAFLAHFAPFLAAALRASGGSTEQRAAIQDVHQVLLTQPI
ncbi:MAG: TetR family transcriptional regulator [Casimicrobiaceae bacterium]|nr:TetR family transcriptional regulator [Casimicrobiaceae bacterium]